MLPVLHFLHMSLSAMEAHAVIWMGFFTHGPLLYQ